MEDSIWLNCSGFIDNQQLKIKIIYNWKSSGKYDCAIVQFYFSRQNGHY
jgi:hypothetical protein